MNVLFVTLFALLAAYAFAGTTMKAGLNTTSSNCGGNCPGYDCPSCPCGTGGNWLDINSWCAQYSWNQVGNFYCALHSFYVFFLQDACRCIVSHESGGNGNAVNYNAGQSASYLWDVGLWQINSYNWNACSGGGAPCDPWQNLQCGKS